MESNDSQINSYETVDATVNLLEDIAFGLDVWDWELDLSVITTWSNRSRVQGLDLIRGHDDLDAPTYVKPVELVEELKHCSFNFALTICHRVVPKRGMSDQ